MKKTKRNKILAVLLCMSMIVSTFASMSQSVCAEDIEAKGTSEPQEPPLVKGNSPDGLVMKKTATANDDGSYTLNLEAYSTGTVTTIDNSKPVDIVMVMDQSGSMAWEFSGATTGKKARLDALMVAANNFVDSVKKAANDNKLEHRIAVVGFSSRNGVQKTGETPRQITVNNTELLTGVTITNGGSYDTWWHNNDIGYYYPYGKKMNGAQYYGTYGQDTDVLNNGGKITTAQYKKAFQNVNTAAGETNIKNAIKALTAHGSTQTLYGLDMAAYILKNNPITDDRDRTVILFTDGQVNSDVDKTIAKANVIKRTYGASVYVVTIGGGNNLQIMNYISSNYPDAVSQTNTGEKNPNLKDGESYYLMSSNASGLNAVYQKISTQIGQSLISIDDKAVIRDTVTDYFELEGDVSDIDVKTYECLSYDETTKQVTWSEEGTVLQNAVTIDKTNKTIDVTGFDFSKNYVAANGRDENDSSKRGTFYGRKVVISFKVTPRDGFWGGNNVPTNGSESGIYENKDADIPVGTFDVPTVNVPINIPNPVSKDKNIYLSGNIPEIEDLYEFKVPTGEDSWKSDYVNININHDEEQVISNINDTEVNLEIIVSPKFNGNGGIGDPVSSVSKKLTANVNVFKPVLMYKDSSAYYGDVALSDYEDNKGSEVWKHGSTLDSDVIMTGEKPNLILSYDPAVNSDKYYNNGKVSTKKDIPIRVQVKINETDVTKHVKFMHGDCNEVNCGFDADKEQFIIHIKTCQLTISKVGGESGEPYVIDVYKDGNLYTSLTLVGNESQTIEELPVGMYIVQENTDWSWRYKTSVPKISEMIALTAGNVSGNITVTNHDRYDEYLNGYSTVVKNILGKKKVD